MLYIYDMCNIVTGRNVTPIMELFIGSELFYERGNKLIK